MAYTDYIRIYGLPQNREECFQGLGAAALYNATEAQPVSGGSPAEQNTTTGSTPEPLTPEKTEAFSSELWTAQSNLLDQQSVYLDDVKATFAEKRQNLNVGFDMKSFVESDIFKWLTDIAIKKIVDLVTDVIPGVQDDLIFDTLVEFAPKAIGSGLIWLNKQYLAGSQLCERMKEENALLTTVKKSFEYYRLRSDIITQHDETIQSLLSQIALVETQIMTDTTGSAGNESEPVIVCPHTGDYIFAHSRGKMTKL